MKNIKFFLISILLISGCQKEEEEIIDLDTMVMSQEGFDDRHLAGDPIFSPQEIPLEESEPPL